MATTDKKKDVEYREIKTRFWTCPVCGEENEESAGGWGMPEPQCKNCPGIFLWGRKTT